MKIVEYAEVKMLLFPSGKIYKCIEDKITACETKIHIQIDPKTLKVSKYARVYFNYRKYSVPKLIASAFLENPRGYKNVRYIDGNPENNDVSNLEWITINRDYGRINQNTYLDGINRSLYGEWNKAAISWILDGDESKLYEFIIMPGTLNRYLYKVLWNAGISKNRIPDVMDKAYEKLLIRLKNHYRVRPSYIGEENFKKYVYILFKYFAAYDDEKEFIPRILGTNKVVSEDINDYIDFSNSKYL